MRKVKLAVKKILLVGSGGLKIGQAGEFDYSGSQAIKALKEEGIEVVLLNPNIATVQTDPGFTDKIYFLPITPYFAEEIIKKERPDGILFGFGGQTALNLGIELDRRGVLKKYRVRVLGTPIRTIEETEDRKLFAASLRKIGVKTAAGRTVDSVARARRVADMIGYPVMVRSAYSLGGENSGPVKNARELKRKLARVFQRSPQAIIEEYLWGWKEIEYEVVRDRYDNCVTVCNMENMDPMGIHTGESIVVAPSQTLDNEEYFRLRDISMRVIRHLGVIGECNIQFALHPETGDYRVIEVNARLSRSSALASKATGYPLAHVAAKLALGYALHELPNAMTGVTSAMFEPALDYIVVKMPRWDLAKFPNADRAIGSEMKSVGEVMGIGRSFEEALQKAIRMLAIGADGITGNRDGVFEFADCKRELAYPTDRRIFAIAQALKDGMSVAKVQKVTAIDPWFLTRIERIVGCASEVEKHPLTPDLLWRAKRLGYSDASIARLVGKREEYVRKLRIRHNVVPVFKQIDTLAGEFPTHTNYLYATYHGNVHDVAPVEKSVIVIGSGPYGIGSSVEFDWSSVQAVRALRKAGKCAIMVNSNPETVSTDYDIADCLYFEELTAERVRDICEFERPEGVIVSVGGQIANNLAPAINRAGIRIMGTDSADIDRAEDRSKFSALLDSLGVPQPPWISATDPDLAVRAAREFGYPVLVRPSYVLSGTAMTVAFDERALKSALAHAAAISDEFPVVVSKFFEQAVEAEIDGAAAEGTITVAALTRHVECAGTHSGDATVVIPAEGVAETARENMFAIAGAIVRELKLTGPFNIQFLLKDGKAYVIECNVRVSRSFPFVSKAIGKNIVEYAVHGMLGKKMPRVKNYSEPASVFVKSPQFSYHRIKGADPLGYVEMASTGEVACGSDTFSDALLKAALSSGLRLPEKGILFSLGKERNKTELLPEVRAMMRMGHRIFATEHTADFLIAHGISAKKVFKIHRRTSPSVADLIERNAVDLIVNIPANHLLREERDGFVLRRMATDHNISLITDLELARALIRAIVTHDSNRFDIAEYAELMDHLKWRVFHVCLCLVV